jgi:exodeoxyribonuclease-3
MKIITWNVNGIRAVLDKGVLGWAWEQMPDVLCLQEVKARQEQLKEIQHSMLKLPCAWNAAQRAGYSGVATFFKEKPLEVRMGFDDPKFDAEGRVIQTLHPEFRLMNVYFPNGQRGRERVDYKLEFYARLLDLCDRLHKDGEQLIITGTRLGAKIFGSWFCGYLSPLVSRQGAIYMVDLSLFGSSAGDWLAP